MSPSISQGMRRTLISLSLLRIIDSSVDSHCQRRRILVRVDARGNQPEVLGPPSPTFPADPVIKEFVGATARGNEKIGRGYPGYEVWPTRMIEISACPAGSSTVRLHQLRERAEGASWVFWY